MGHAGCLTDTDVGWMYRNPPVTWPFRDNSQDDRDADNSRLKRGSNADVLPKADPFRKRPQSH